MYKTVKVGTGRHDNVLCA